MKFSETKQGRTFIIRLEHGEIIHECLESFAKQHQINAASVLALGGVDAGSLFVTGPACGTSAPPIEPNLVTLNEAHEVCGTGTIFPDKDGNPILHMHLAAGRNDQTITGCIRTGVKTWHVLEVVLQELLNSTARRLPDSTTGFELLTP